MRSRNQTSISKKYKDHHFQTVHFVCTLEQAEQFITQKELFWVSNCHCREENKGCGCSRTDVCLYFSPEAGGIGSGLRRADRDYIRDILAAARKHHLVPRPFYIKDNPSCVLGICFCCTDCCFYFGKEQEICEKGKFMEKTDRDACIDCGTCADVCGFGARKIEAGELVIDRNSCFGCGLCSEVCPMHCITMISRTEKDK